jgi:ubiquinone/menaquinone biosynthesis C-methylase UbiE
VTEHQLQSFDPFAKEAAYVRVNERLIDRTLKKLAGCGAVRMLDIAAGTGLMSILAFKQARDEGIELRSTMLDMDRGALLIAQEEVGPRDADYVYASADHLPFRQTFDVAIFANSLHLLDDSAKRSALQEVQRVLKPGAVLAFNSTFYEGAYPEESKPFYSRWIRRSIAEINRRLPSRSKGERAQAMEFLPASAYQDLVECAGFRIVEMRERRVLLSQAAVRAICRYKDFVKGALHATDEDAEEASQALQVTVKQTFRDLQMKALPRNWLEIIAVRA